MNSCEWELICSNAVESKKIIFLIILQKNTEGEELNNEKLGMRYEYLCQGYGNDDTFLDTACKPFHEVGQWEKKPMISFDRF